MSDNAGSKLRILLADDHQIVRQGLRVLIEANNDMEVVGEASDGVEAIEKTALLRPDMLVLDISMPRMDGVEAIPKALAASPATKVIALTVQEDLSYLTQLLKLGASGYVLKRAAAEDLVRAIWTVAKGGKYLDPVMAEKVVGEYVLAAPSRASRSAGDLSAREKDVLCLTAWGHANKEIAAKLKISVKTVETYRCRLMEKLNLRSRADIVRYALGQGWLHEE